MTNDYGEYLEYKINQAQTEEERKYYEQLKALNDSNNYNSPNNLSVNQNTIAKGYVKPSNKGGNDNQNTQSYESIKPTTVQSDESLQDALNGEPIEEDYDSGQLDLTNQTWDGMASGSIEGGRPSTQEPEWMKTVPIEYRKKVEEWSNMQGIMEITPREQRQKFTYSTVAYIADNNKEPKTQRFPISDVSVIPHQINFDFYDTTEGRVGVSHATEKHQTIELDIYVTDYVFYYWNSGGDNKNAYNLHLPETISKIFWKSIKEKTYTDKNFLLDVEQTKDFADFRNTFLQQHLGWLCDFNSHAFGKFTGVINDVSYQISNGESFAKWHIKLEEAIFTEEGYSPEGQKPSEDSTTSDGSEIDSGTATDVEAIPQ